MILALDPGIGGCGLAAFDGRLLHWAGYARNITRSPTKDPLEDAASMAQSVAFALAAQAIRPTRLVSEWMIVYAAGKGKAGADPNDLLKLTAVSGAVARELRVPCSCVEPRGWKGTLGDNADGDYVPELRIFGRGGILSADETHRVDWPAESLRHNVVDAVGIGLWAVGRGLTNGGRKLVLAR